MSIGKIIFAACCPVMLATASCLLSYVIYKIFYERKHYKDLAYKAIYKMVMNHDYLLINNYAVPGSDIVIDHLVFAKKYIYVILTREFHYDLFGKTGDSSFVSYNKDAKKIYVANVLKELEMDIKTLSMAFDIDYTFFKGVVIINQECSLHVENTDTNKTVIHFHDLKKTIATYEKDKTVGELDQDAILAIARKVKEKQKV